MKKLVSIITPCFNGEKFVHRLLNSVLEQSYPNIEHVFIDDGSTDKTAEIINAYIPKYEKRGIKLIYIYQKNARAAAALNRGLKLFTGDYLTWPDSDDYYRSNDAIAIMVDTFENLSDEYGIVRCDAMLTEENTQEALYKFSDNNPNVRKENLFEDCLLEINFWFTPGCFLTSAAVFDDVVQNRDIFVNLDGQNWQMFLPILYTYKCYYIDKPLFNYLVRANSYCNQPISFDLAIKRSFIHEEIIIETLKRMDLKQDQLNKYLLLIKRKYLNMRLSICFSHMQKEEFKKSYLKLKTDFPEDISLKFRIKKRVINNPIIFRFINKIYK